MTLTADSPVTRPDSLDRHRIGDLLVGLRRGPGGPDGELEVRMPYTGQVLTRLPSSSQAQVAEAARVGRRAQRDWAARGASSRAAVLGRWHDAVLAHADELCDVIQAENGKSRASAFEEVADTANTLRYYALTAEKVLAPERRHGLIPLLTSATVHHRPIGLVGIISPWNYPLTLGAGDGVAALAAGNALLHLPDAHTTLTTLMVRELAVAAGLPAGVWQVVAGDGGTVGPALIDQVDHLVFTGSTATGRTVAAQAGKRLIRADLELGGKNAMIVCHDASLSAAVRGAVTGSFASTGQLCLSMERIYVHQSVYEKFMTSFAAATDKLTLGARFDYRADVGSLIGPAQLATVREHVQDAVTKGARIVAGGEPRPDIGPYFFEPTVLADVPAEARCFGEETFGPVVSVYPVADDEEAVTRANASAYGLNASVYSSNRSHARAIAKRLEAGTVNINEPYAAAWGSVDAPMGGVKNSGVGRRHGPEGLLATTWAHTIARQRFWPVGPRGVLRGKRYQAVMTSGLKTFKALRRR